MKINLLTLFLLFLGVVKMSSQTTFGLRAGGAYSRLANSPYLYLENTNTEEEALLGANIAIFISIPLADRFFLQPEINYLQKGEKYKAVLPTPAGSLFEVNTKRIFEYLEVPILLKGKIISGKVNLSLFAGPSIGYALTSKFEGATIATFINGQPTFYSSGDVSWDNDFSNDNSKDIRYDISGATGISFEYNMGVSTVILDFRYLHDFNDWKEYSGVEQQDKVLNRSFIISLGIGF